MKNTCSRVVSLNLSQIEANMEIYKEIKEIFETQRIRRHCSEFHGMIIGMMSSGGLNFRSDELYVWLEAYLGCAPSAKLTSIVNAVLEQGAESLDEYSNFEFDLALPPDESPLNEQVIALSAWCSGFVAAAEKYGLTSASFENAMIKETIQDFRRISEISEDIDDSDENESDYTQLKEFVRVGALTVYCETRTKRT